MNPEDKQLLQDIWKELVATRTTLDKKIDALDLKLSGRIDGLEVKLDEHIKYSKAMFRNLSGMIAETNLKVGELDERVGRIEDRLGPKPSNGA